METSLTLLLHVNLPLFLWVENFLTVVLLINILSSLVFKMVTPFVNLYREQPDYNNLKVLGCRCFSYIMGSNKFSSTITLVCSQGTIAYTKDIYIYSIIPLQRGCTYLNMLCSMKTHYPTCLQINLILTLMSHVTLLLLLNLTLHYRHMIIIILEKYSLIVHKLLVGILQQPMYSLIMIVLLTSQDQDNMMIMRNRSKVVIQTEVGQDPGVNLGYARGNEEYVTCVVSVNGGLSNPTLCVF